MRGVVLAATLVAACAAPREATVAPTSADVSAAPRSGTPEILPRPTSPPHAARLADRLQGISAGKLTEGWPRCDHLPKPEACYDAAFVGEDLASDGWRYDVLVDLECPRIVWVRTTGTIAGIREYRGPAEIVDESGPVVFRVGQ